MTTLATTLQSPHYREAPAEGFKGGMKEEQGREKVEEEKALEFFQPCLIL